MRRFLRENSLSIVMFGLFFVFLLLQSLTGWRTTNQEHQQPNDSYVGYLGSGSFAEATFENWESEFLAVFALTVLGIFLRQRGSPESKLVAAPHAETGS